MFKADIAVGIEPLQFTFVLMKVFTHPVPWMSNSIRSRELGLITFKDILPFI